MNTEDWAVISKYPKLSLKTFVVDNNDYANEEQYMQKTTCEI